MSDADQRTPEQHEQFPRRLHPLSRLPFSGLVTLLTLHILRAFRWLRQAPARSLSSLRDLPELLRITSIRGRRVLLYWRGAALRSARARPLRALTVASLLVILLASCLGSIVTLLPRLTHAQTTFTPNTYSSFTSTGNALASASASFTPIPPTGPAQDGGTSPGSAPPASGTPLTNPVRLALDGQHLYDGTSAVGDPTAASPITSSEGILSLQVADHAVDIATASVPGAGLLGSSVSASSDGPLTLELKPTTGTFRGASMALAGFALHVVDAQNREAQGVSLHAPLLLTFHYHPKELAGLNTQDLRLVWPATADQPHSKPSAWVPVMVNSQSATLTASVSTLQSGPMLLAGAQSDANPASSEHLQMTGNNGDVTFTVPFDVPPAAGGLAPNLQLVYSSGGPNGRYARNAPAPWTGDGWNLSLGSISYDSSNELYYLNGVGGDSEVLLCCHNTGTNGINYFVPHHHADIRVFASDNSIDPRLTGASFVVRTPDGLEYDLGATVDSKRTTVVSGALQTIEWDVNKVARLYDTGSGSSGTLQQYTVTYWQDTASSGGISYTRDAAPREIDYNYVGGSALARIYFNVHWPGSTTTSGPATATSYGTNYNCSTSRAPLLATTLRCDDPVQPAGYEAPPLTMSTLTLDGVVMQVQSGGSWHTARTYQLGYAPDLPTTTCTDDYSGQVYACDGEHLLSSVQETPYQNDTPMPSLQPITFAYSSATLNEYHDTTEKGFDNNLYDAQTWWQYLTSFSDGQTGAGASVAYKRAYGNSWGVPSGSVTDPFNCDTNSCLVPEDRQWPRQAVSQITDTGTGATTTYSYGLNLACGTNCTEDTWIPPNGWNTCGDAGLPPTTRPMPACLESGWQNYYNEEFTGFLQVYATQPDGSTDYTQYYAGNGWGTNDWDTANLARNAPQVEEVFQGAAGGTLLHEIDHAYTTLNCPSGVFNNGQLYNNPYMFCLNNEVQTDTYQDGGSSSNPAVPHEQIARTYDPYFWYTMLDSSAASTNDALADSATNYSSTQPTFTTNYSYTGRDGAAESPATPYYFEELVQSQTQTDNLGNRWTCQTTQYDGLWFLPNFFQSSIKYALPTQSNAYSDCGTSGTNYTTSGEVSTGTGYDAFGRAIVSTDADSLAGVSGHTGCTPGASVLVAYPTSASSYTACTTYDSAQHAYATVSANALAQHSSAAWDVVQGVPTSSTDPNNATTSYAGPIYEYSGSPSLATYQDTYAQQALPGETYGSPAWTTRVFTFSFCTGATTGGKPCLEVDTVRQLDGTNLAVARQFYDRDGRLVETRSSGPMVAHDTVTFTVYDEAHDKVFQSLSCSLPALTTGNGGRAVSSTPNYIAPTQTSSGSSAYVDPAASNGTCTPTLTGTTTYLDALGRALATDDPMGTGAGTSGSGCVLPGGNTHHTTCTTFTAVVASSTSGLPSGDTEPYVQTLTIDANLHQSANYTDALGRTAYAQRFSGASQNPQGSGISSYSVTTYTYDGAGNLVSIVDPQGHTTTFGYNKLSQQMSLADPDRGAESYSYDANGNVTQTVDARGASGTIYAGYDGLNRQLWRNSTNSSSGAYVTYSYDSTASGNDGVGRLTGESFNGGNGGTALGHGSYSSTYDARGQKTGWGVTLGGATSTFGFTSTDFGASNTLTYSDGELASYGYSSSGALLSLSTTPPGGSAATLFGTLFYSTAAGTSALLSSASVANNTDTYSPTYDGDLRLASQTWTTTSTGATIFRSARTYDNVGNVTSVATTLPAGTDNQAFCYDEQDRLTWASSASATPPCGGSLSSGSLTSAGYGPVSYGYDPLDRMTSSPSGANVYGDSAHLHAETSIGTAYSARYDAAGNMTCRAPTSSTPCSGGANGELLTYDTEGRLIAWQNAPLNPTATEAMAYDGEGHRVALQVNGGTPTYYLGSLEEISGSTLTKYFSAGDGLPTAMRVGSSGSLSYLPTDGLGTVSEALDGSGTVTFQELFTPYGTRRFASGSAPTTKAFTGQRSDSANGLDYYNARYYDPTGRQFISADTVRDGQNAYAYVLQNPCTNLDPSGQCVQRPTGWGNRLRAIAYAISLIWQVIVGGAEQIDQNVTSNIPTGQQVPDTGTNEYTGGGGERIRGDRGGSELSKGTGGATSGSGGPPCPDDDPGKGGTPYRLVLPDGTPIGTVPNATPAPAPAHEWGPGGSGQVAGPQVPEVNGPNGRKVGQSWGHLVQTQLAMLRAEQMAGISDVWYLLSYLYALSHPHVQSSPAQVSNPGWCIGPVCINPYVWGLEIGAKLAQANEPSTSETTQPIEVDVPDIGIDGGHAGLVY